MQFYLTKIIKTTISFNFEFFIKNIIRQTNKDEIKDRIEMIQNVGFWINTISCSAQKDKDRSLTNRITSWNELYTMKYVNLGKQI